MFPLILNSQTREDRGMDVCAQAPVSVEEPQTGRLGIVMSLDVRLVLIVMGLALGIRWWHFATTEVTSRDSIHYIRMAWDISQGRVIHAIRNSEQHPGYPFWICAVDTVVGPLMPGSLAERYQRSSQVASIIASVALVPVAYMLSRQMFSSWGAFLGCLFIQVLPAMARLFADGLSEALFLLLVMSSMLFGYIALRGQKLWPYALCGLSGGMAYLVRPEGALFPVAFGLVLFGMTMQRAGAPWLRPAAALALGFLIMAVPFVAIVGKLTSKPTANRVLTADSVSAPVPPDSPLIASWFTSSSHGMGREAWALWIFLGMLARGTLFVLWLPALLTLIFCRNHVWTQPGTIAVVIACTGLEVLLQRVAATMGYLSDRHMIVIVAFAAILAGGGISEFCNRFLGWRRILVAGILVLPLLAVGLYRTVEPLHGNRAGFKQAGQWIAANTPIGDPVVDPFCWTHFYAGRLFLEAETKGLPITHPRRLLVVVDRSASKHERLPVQSEDKLKEKGGTPVFTFESSRRRTGEGVVVYAVPLGS